jgi:hypothetical protein
VTNLEVLKVYRLLDTVALFAVLGLLFFYLRQTAPPSHSVAGFLYVAAILPLTYFFAYFQPWDRVSLACWIGLIMLLRAKRLIAFTVLLAFSMTIKFDTILLPGLYLLANISRDNWRRVVLRSALMFGVSFAVLVGLIVLLPRGFEGGSMAAQLLINLRGLRATLFSYPPLLGFLLPFILAVIGLRQADRFSRACVAFGTLLLVPLVASTNFIEIRAELPMLVLLLPAACKGLAILCREESDAGSVVFARDPESAYAGAGSAHALLGEGWAEGWVGWSVARAPAETLAFAPRGITSLSTLPPDDFPAIVDSLDAS